MIIRGRTYVAEDCLAKDGNGANLADADFELNVYECCQANGGAPIVNIWGAFYEPGTPEDDQDNTMQTGVMEVSSESLAARWAEQILDDESGRLVAEVGRILKTGAAACTCFFANQCPRLDEMHLALAIEAAIKNR